ncbi:MAG: alpha/beta hydrolase [Chloroflexota bacterium]|nr:alpha/beta hydrolase [Chloroflexota bacterium]
MTSSAVPTRLTQYVSRPHGRIAYDLQGSGPLVLLVPGMGELRSSYRFLTPALVAAGYTVATTDLRGHGDSAATFDSYGDDDTAGDLVALLQKLGEPAVIVGNSMAAGAGVISATDRPDLVDGLVLVGPFVRNPASSAFEQFLFRLLMARPWAAASWGSYLPKLYAGRKPADFDAYHKDIGKALRRPGYSKAFSLTTRTRHQLAETRLPAVKVPVLVVMGDQDPDFKNPQTEAEWIAKAVSGRFVMVPSAGHYPQSQQPELTAQVITEFLSSVRPHA